MATQGDDPRQHGDRFAWLDSIGNDLGVRGDSNERELSDRAGSPRVVSAFVKPLLRLAVMDVMRPGERDQDIAVEQLNRQTSSSWRRTSSLVSGRAPADTANTGNPFLVPPSRFCGASPRRASSDKAFPKLMERAAASCRAALKISGSRSTVVRIEVPTVSESRDVSRYRADMQLAQICWRCLGNSRTGRANVSMALAAAV